MVKVPEGLTPIIEVDDIPRYRPPMEEVRGLSWNIGGMVMRSSFEVRRLVAVTRGGLTPTDCISRATGIKDIQTLAVEVYEPSDEEGGEAPEVPQDDIKVYRKPHLPKDGRGTLFVDDVLDTGKTAGFIRETWPKAAIAAVYTKHLHDETMARVNFYGQYVGGIWIDFPWEVEAQTREDIRRSGNGMVV